MQHNDELDAFSLGMVTNNKIAGVLPVLFTQMNDERQFMYNVTSKVNLRQYMSGKIARTQCIRIFAGIAESIMACSEYMLNTSVLLLDPDCIFVNVGTGETFLVCLPLAGRMEIVDIAAFFKGLLTNMRFSAEDPMDYPAKIINALNDCGSYSYEEFKNRLAELDEEKSVCHIPKPIPDDENKKHHHEPLDIEAAIEVDSFLEDIDEGKKPDRKKGSFFHFFRNRSGDHTKNESVKHDTLPALSFEVPGFDAVSRRAHARQPAKKPLDFGETTTLDEDAAEEGTMLLKESVVKESGQKRPYLLRIRTNETIPINESIFKIGKEKSYVNYFLNDNPTVSRSHADIVKLGDKYHIIDNNSTNHTYLNGHIIRSNAEVPLDDGAQIMLGNEEFEFHCV